MRRATAMPLDRGAMAAATQRAALPPFATTSLPTRRATRPPTSPTPPARSHTRACSPPRASSPSWRRPSSLASAPVGTGATTAIAPPLAVVDIAAATSAAATSSSASALELAAWRPQGAGPPNEVAGSSRARWGGNWPAWPSTTHPGVRECTSTNVARGLAAPRKMAGHPYDAERARAVLGGTCAVTGASRARCDSARRGRDRGASR